MRVAKWARLFSFQSHLCFCVENKAGLKIRGTNSQSMKPFLGWKFWVLDLLHKPQVPQASLAHLMARMDWAHVKSLIETNPNPPNHASSISPTIYMGLGHATKQNKIEMIHGLGPLSDWAQLPCGHVKFVTKITINTLQELIKKYSIVLNSKRSYIKGFSLKVY